MKFYCRAKAQVTVKQHVWKIAFLLSSLFPRKYSDNNFGQLPPPSTLQGVGLGGRKNPRIIVGENYCHFGASYIRVGFWQNGFFADFYFWAAGFFRGFCRRIFSPHFCGEKVPRKILQENPRQNPPKFIQQKSPTHFCRGAGPTYIGAPCSTACMGCFQGIKPSWTAQVVQSSTSVWREAALASRSIRTSLPWQASGWSG